MPAMSLRFRSRAFAAIAFAGALAACHPEVSDGAGAAGGQGGVGGSPPPPPVTTTIHPNRPPLPGFTSCDVTTVENVPFEGHTHQPVCTVIDYTSNPPSSGDHWPVWAAFKEYASPVPREMYVHDLEHGAIVMLYECDPACPDVVSALEAARDAIGVDPLCTTTNPAGPPARVVLTPDPKLAVPLALAAWQATYVATCIDPPSLAAFAQKHYGHGTEQLCADGKDPASEESGVPACDMTF
jgi:hypothetical protein